jgi:hypothetical protein
MVFRFITNPLSCVVLWNRCLKKNYPDPTSPAVAAQYSVVVRCSAAEKEEKIPEPAATEAAQTVVYLAGLLPRWKWECPHLCYGEYDPPELQVWRSRLLQ